MIGILFRKLMQNEFKYNDKCADASKREKMLEF